MTGSIQQLLLDCTVSHILTVHSYPQFYPREIGSFFSIMRKPYMASFLPWLAPLRAHTGMIPHFFHVFCGSSRVPSCIYWTFTKWKIYIYKRLLPCRNDWVGTFSWHYRIWDTLLYATANYTSTTQKWIYMEL